MDAYGENAAWEETYPRLWQAPKATQHPRLVWPPQEPIVVVSNWPENWDEELRDE